MKSIEMITFGRLKSFLDFTVSSLQLFLLPKFATNTAKVGKGHFVYFRDLKASMNFLGAICP